MKSNVHRVIAGLVSFAAIVTASRASAQERVEIEEPWFFVIDGMVSGPINDLARQQFDVGGSGALGAYRSFAPELAFGLRLGAGVLSADRIIPQDPVDRGALDFGQLSASMRVRPFARLVDDDGRRTTGLWIQTGAGPWLVDGDVVPAFDAGIGYGFEVGPIVISPMGQFTHVVETEDRFGQGFILMWNGGIEVAFLDEVRGGAAEGALDMKPSSDRAMGPPLAAIEREDSEREDIEREDAMREDAMREDAMRDDAALAATPEPLPTEEDVAQPFVNDQLVVDERVFFDFDGWALRETGMEQLDEVVRRYEESGEGWAALVISGHADRRGPEGYNLDLSRKRAQAVRRYLAAHGVPDEIVEIQAWGESRPEIPDARSEWDHQVNRRVQFDIVWREGMRPEGQAPQRDPVMPDHVDPAPPHLRDAD